MTARIAATLALVAQVLVLVFLYVPAGLVVPAPAWLLLIALGLGLAVLAVRLARRGSFAVLLVPVASALLWFAYVEGGVAIFGWTP